MRGHYRHTKIIATIGPSTESLEKLGQLISSGVDVIRLNMAHGTGEWITAVIKRIREASHQVNRHVAVMMDVKGPEIRTGPVAESIDLKTGDHFEFYTAEPTPGSTGVIVNYAGFPADVKVGATVLLDSGLIRLEVLNKDTTHVRCRVLTPGKLGSRRHINLPGVDVNLPSLTEKDEKDIRVGVEAGIDFVALSFVRRSDDILVLRALLDHLGSKA
ncbi:MAG TPA: pyruvate kinase, partial [Tepidisphaeraceae bacterium]